MQHAEVGHDRERGGRFFRPPAERVVIVRALAALGLVLLLLLAPSAQAQERLCTEALVPTSDGVRLHAWVSRLSPDVKRPVLFMMDSYARSGHPGQGPSMDNACPEVLPDDYVPAFISEEIVKQFTLVQVSYRGTGGSEGEFDLTGPRTQQDIREAIAWAARLPQSNGDVVLIGESGTGFYAHHGLQEPAVRAAVIFTSCADMYRCAYRGGQNNGLMGVYLGVTHVGYARGLESRQRMGTVANPVAPVQEAALARATAMSAANGVNDAYWQERSSLGKLRAVSKPVMFTADHYDIVQPFDALQLVPNARFVFGMGHTIAPGYQAAGERWNQLVRPSVDRFVAHYGLGQTNRAERDPKVTLLTNLGGQPTYRAGEMVVRQEERWPLPSTRWTRVYLSGAPSGTAGSPNDGSLATSPADEGDSDSAPMVPGPAPDLRTRGWLAGDVSDLREDESRGLTYTTPELKNDLEITGPIAVRLFASATAPDFDWSVRITDVHPDGRSEWITDGYLRASLRQVDVARSLKDTAGEIVRPWLTYSQPATVAPGEVAEYQIDVISTSNVFRAGHRLRLDILPVASAAADSPRSGGAGQLTVLRDLKHPSSLSLPVIPNRCGAGRPLAPTTKAPTSCARSYRGALGEPEPGDTAETAETAETALAPRHCVSRRSIRLRPHTPRRNRLRTVTVYLRGKRVRTIRAHGARRTKATISLRGLPRGRFTVRIVMRATSGRTYVQTRRYRTCAPKR